MEKSKCAVVGSGPSILDNLYGEEIDSYDCVIRCNRAVVRGYEKHVGSRTDKRVLNTHVLSSMVDFNAMLDHYTSEFEKWESIKISQLIEDNEFLYLKDANSEGLKNIKKIINNDMAIVPDYVLKYKDKIDSLTSGFCAIVIASKEFDEVSCYGFDFFRQDNHDHYYEKVNKPFSTHQIDIEEDILRKLYNVKFVE